MTHHATYSPAPAPLSPELRSAVPPATVSAPDTRVGAPAGVAGVETAGMHEALTDKHTRPDGVPTAPATPAVAGAAPAATPATPATSKAAPAVRGLAAPRRPQGGQEGVPTAPANGHAAGAAPAATPATHDAPEGAVAEGGQGPGRVSAGVTRVLAALTLLGMIPVAGVGFAASYDTLRQAAQDKGFSETLSYWVPVGIDGAIIAFLALDLYLTARRIPWPFLRFAAHGMTLATVAFNASGSGKPLAEDPVGFFWHGLMPVLFVVGVEAVRRLVLHATQIEDGTVTDRIPLNRWVLSPIATGRLYRRMRLANVRSYAKMVKREQDLHGYRVWLTQELGGDLSQASEVQRLPMTMAPRGYTVDQALALPARWETEAAERARAEAERQAQAAAEAAERARAEAEREALAAAEAEERAAELAIKKVESAARVEAARHRVSAETGTAAADAEATTAEAQARAETARMRAEQMRAQAERAAQTEAQAFESEAAAAALRRAEEDSLKAERAVADAQAERRRAAAEEAEAARLEAEAETTRAQAARAAKDAEQAVADSERLRAEAAEARRRASVLEAEAQMADDWAGLNPRQRRARQVARMILAAGGDAKTVDVVSLADIEAATGVKRTVSGELRQEAGELLASGYDPATTYTAAART
ncbi:DUF2637 domain-containing protein [Streptomyces venezuelae]|uniref:DUF2637 domain-containing protein n=1 Tax=Streptomyces venezuelae TaxID=54571 RepID=UPI0034381841